MFLTRLACALKLPMQVSLDELHDAKHHTDERENAAPVMHRNKKEPMRGTIQHPLLASGLVNDGLSCAFTQQSADDPGQRGRDKHGGAKDLKFSPD